MAPSAVLNQMLKRQYDGDMTTWTSQALTTQWSSPKDILSVLLLLGPNLVHQAIASLAGRPVTPVAFSFGWVTYAMAALSSVFGGELVAAPLPGNDAGTG
jgi:hypothetical protein